jgi:NAD(P)-dependent dehydrogenase (short-subunit alcohol dehydrogenase family)
MENRLSDLAGKTYLVTGASSGIGAATVLALGLAGANVVLAARTEEMCEVLAKEIVAAGGQALVVRTDVGVEADVRNAVNAAVAHFGRLDGAFNNAGVLGVSAPLHEIATEDFDAVMRINVMGVFWSMKYEIEALLKTGGGAIVNNASIAAQIGFATLSPYNTSKHGVMGLTRTAALEYFKQGIRVNAVCPGPVATPMANIGFGSAENLHATMAGSPAGRAGLPEEIASPVLFLLSSAASYINGQGLTADGDYTVE